MSPRIQVKPLKNKNSDSRKRPERGYEVLIGELYLPFHQVELRIVFRVSELETREPGKKRELKEKLKNQSELAGNER
jgi:hypothetical protein